ncbi:nucleoside hydrolase [Candidatus Woesearchaeota archaeon]|nr:nucleoside hydrolase [Candidatus Woesearchaeota archaeon]
MSKQIIIDTDIGSDIDDAYALVLALNSPEIKIKAIITNNSEPEKKAKIVGAFTKNIPIFYGIDTKKGFLTTDICNKDTKTEPLQENTDFFKDEELTYISIGALSNLAFFLDQGFKFKNVIIMGGSINTTYSGEKKKVKEWNFNCDLDATKKVFNSNLNILLVPLDVTWDLELNEENITKIKKNKKETSILLNKHLNDMRKFLYKNYNIDFKKPILHDPLAVYASYDESLFKTEYLRLSISDDGILEEKKEAKNIRVIKEVNKEFIPFFIKRILS